MARLTGCRVCSCVLLFLLVVGNVHAAASFRLEHVTSLPETRDLPVGFFLQGSGAVSVLEIEISYPQADLELLGVQLDDALTDLAPAITLAAVPQGGRATLEIAFPTAMQLDDMEVHVLDFVYFLGGGITPGTVLPITFATAPYITLAGQRLQALPTNGSVTIPDDNFLLLGDGWGYPGQERIPVELKAFNKDPLMGLSVSCAFDASALQLHDVTMENTLTEALECEFFQPQINNETGTMVLGILLDATIPYTLSKHYPVSGYRLRIARLLVDVRTEALPEQTVPLLFEDGHGTPPIHNRVVVSHESIVPQTLDGAFTIGRVPRFVRGDVNSDGRIDIADPISVSLYLFLDHQINCVKAADADDDGEVRINDAVYMLNYLFLRGRLIPAPFPGPGLDPTPDDLPCLVPLN